MGSLFSKRNNETNAPEYTNVKRRFWKKQPRNADSTQSLNTDSDRVSASPNPNDNHQPKRAQSLSNLPSPEAPPPLPLRQQEKRAKTQAKSYVDVGVSPTLRSESSPGPSKETANQRLTAPGKLYPENHYSSPNSSSAQDVIANRNSVSNTRIDISFKPGDTIHIGDRKDDGRYVAKNLRTGKEGLVSANCETMVTSNDVESQKCFFKDMDRKAADAKLIDPDLELGTYLLRPSDENSGLQCELKWPFTENDPLNGIAVKYEDLELGEKLGSGNFATVHAGTLYGSKPVAVKSLTEASSMTVEEFRMEAEMMRKLRHPNLVSLLAISESSGKIYIIMERMSKGALLNLLRQDDDRVITFKDIMDMAIQVVEGMCFLERKSFVHRDLRAANVLVGEGNVVKIADFGLTRLLDEYYRHEEYYQSTKDSLFPYKWTAPEAINRLRFTIKSDVWSFGILLYEMVTHGYEPYPAMTNHESLVWVEAGNRLARPTDYHCPLALYNIMKQCWLKNYMERPNFEDIKDNLIEIKTNA